MKQTKQITSFSLNLNAQDMMRTMRLALFNRKSLQIRTFEESLYMDKPLMMSVNTPGRRKVSPRVLCDIGWCHKGRFFHFVGAQVKVNQRRWFPQQEVANRGLNMLFHFTIDGWVECFFNRRITAHWQSCRVTWGKRKHADDKSTHRHFCADHKRSLTKRMSDGAWGSNEGDRKRVWEWRTKKKKA